ncbi:ribonuclease H-like domain-containing protein [Candidatus Woesearchaeota archaeon]|nr:ribonuclease H-like domain-containing protein [Candidatus Woesearchaeota archaeon]
MITLRFFLTDISYRIEANKAVVHLYGRTKEGEVVCVHDETFEPYFYVLPRNPTIKDELETLKASDKGNAYSVVRVEEVMRKVNEQEQRLFKVTVNLPSGVPVLRDAIKGHPAVKDCFEYDITFVRRYLIDKGLQPLTLVEAKGQPHTERSRVPVLKAASVKQASDETLTPNIVSFDIETYNSGGKVQMDKDPILMIAFWGKNVRKVLTWKRFETADPVEFLPTEADMLQRFKEIVGELKPDILAGYYSDGFDLPFIIKRAKKYKIPMDFSLDGSEVKVEGKTQSTVKIAGIVHVDMLKFIRKIIGRSMQTDVFTLDAVAKELLGEGKAVVDLDSLPRAWDANQGLAEYAAYNLQDTKLTYHLCEKILPNMMEFVKLIGVPLWDINRMSFSQLVEWYIIKQASIAHEVVMNRPGYQQQMGRMTARFKGALVYEPTPGLYDDIVVFDYRSLYPSIIASHNISPGMLNCACCPDAPKVPFADAEMRFCVKRKGFLSFIIEDIITHRARIKELLKKEKDVLLSARSEALKVLANAFYGYLGFAPARWYSFECGQSVTAYGRHYITDVIEQAKKGGFIVLYSDTDSIFLLLGKKTKEDAVRFVEHINKSLPGLMELDYEGFYPRALFVATKGSDAGAKKKYALIDKKGVLKIRGFETVRRNTSFIAKDAQREVLQIILGEGDAQKAAAHVKQIVADLKTNRIPLAKVVIWTQLTKDVSEYGSISPHVAAAKRLADRGTPAKAGEMIKYVVMKGTGKIRDRVKLEDEAKQEEYDGDYYIEHQVIPVVEKIFEVLGISVDELEKKGQQKTLGGF